MATVTIPIGSMTGLELDDDGAALVNSSGAAMNERDQVVFLDPGQMLLVAGILLGELQRRHPSNEGAQALTQAATYLAITHRYELSVATLPSGFVARNDFGSGVVVLERRDDAGSIVRAAVVTP